MRLIPLAIRMLLLAPLLHAAAPLSSYLPDAALAPLRAGERTFASIPADGSLRLAPAVTSLGRIAQDVRTSKPTVGVEMLRIIGGLARPSDTPEAWLALYNAMHAASTMQGITYWSVTKASEQVLFLQSYALSSAVDGRRIADPTFTSLPAEDELITFQEDAHFGRNTFRERFSYRGDHVVMRIENVSTISFLLVPYLKPGGIVSEVVLVPSGREILLYGIAYLHTGLPTGDRAAREESLKNRLIALSNWLAARVAAP
jgi:hypothetical protein